MQFLERGRPMTQGLFAATTGIRTNQTAIDVISNNVANVNTLAFKASKANFQTIYSRTFSGGSAPNGNLGGVNPKQLGVGAQVGEIGKIFTQGGSQLTGRTTDLLINGNGFFTIQANTRGDDDGVKFTRAGNFQLDSTGQLVTVNAQHVRGSSTVDGRSPLTDSIVQVPLEFQVAKFLDANQQVQDVAIGGLASTAADFTAYTVANGLTPASTDTSTVNLISIDIGAAGNITANYSNGDRVSVRQNPDATTNRTELVYFPAEGGTYGAINNAADNGSMGQLGGANAIFDAPAGGNPLEGMQMQLMMATVVNPHGLIDDGGNNYIDGANSGDVFYGQPGQGARGTIQSGQLESSNVDLATEFTNLVVHQRGLEAASRMIQAQSQVLQNIINATQ